MTIPQMTISTMMILHMITASSKRMVVALVMMAIGCVFAYAQPQISYIIPDLGTPRFATYVEFIGPYDRVGNFGSDGIYDNHRSGNVRVRTARNSDSVYVTVGPCIVSWNGRMISTHIFVSEKATPNSDVWSQLDQQWRIPIVVEVNGQVGAADTFYIVKPFKMGDRRGDVQSTFGAGTLGVRSRRGAMLIDHMLLAGTREYTVSTNDCDPLTRGNQGFLPFTLIAVDSIVGTNNATNIRVSANGRDAGPGGGGGGGGYANVLTASSQRGEPGGKGYTGGGPGGYNATIGSNSRRQPGVGTGDSLVENNNNAVGSRSLNNLPGGDGGPQFENAGGGTGHPFGASGIACNDYRTCDPPGGMGGGSGGRDAVVKNGYARTGGAGGYGTDGSGDVDFNNGGKAHGNLCIVPLAGGSGGASGNPSGIGTTSSSGGGGGGAISLHAKLVGGVSVYANGTSASLQTYGAGAGSGGGVILGTRLDNNIYSGMSAIATSKPEREDRDRGGEGRKRYDSRSDPFPGIHIGPTTDTITAALRTFDLNGSAGGLEVEFWVRSDKQEWTKIGTARNTTTGYRARLTLPGTDTLYYLSIIQRTENPSSVPFVAIPQGVMSQSAWNIIRIFGPPVISAPASRDLGNYRCPGSTIVDTIIVENKGESPLEIKTPTWQTGGDFRLASPTVFPDTIARFSSKKYIVEYTPGTGVNGVVNNVLTLENNDTARARNPFRISFTVKVEPIKVQYRWSNKFIDTINLDQVCLGMNMVEQVGIRNSGTVPFTIEKVESLNPGVINVTGGFPATLASLAEIPVTIGGTLRTIGSIIVPLVIYVQDCPEPDTLYVKLTSVEARMTAVGSTQFGTIPVGTTRTQLVELRNDGSSDLIISNLPSISAPFRIVSANPNPVATIKPGSSMILEIEYAPATARDDSATLVIGSTSGSGSCPDTVVLALAGRGAQSDLVTNKQELVFGDVQACMGIVDSIIVRNQGNAAVIVLYPAFLTGPGASFYNLLSQPTVDQNLAPGDTIVYIVEARGSASAGQIQTALLSIRTQSTTQPQLDIPLSARHTAIAFNGPLTHDAGTVVLGNSGSATVRYTNNTSLPVHVSAVRSSLPVFAITPQDVTVQAGDPQDFTVTFTPVVQGPVVGTVWLIIDAPCLDSVALTVRGEGEAGTVSYANALPFGVLTNCEFKLDSVVYVNTSGVNVDIIDASIDGPDKALFTLRNPVPSAGIILKPNESHAILIQFDPRLTNDGVKTATLSTRIRLNNQPVIFSTALSGTRRTSLPSTPVEVKFGQIDIGSTISQMVSIVNTTAGPVHITTIGLRGTAGGVFTFNAPQAPLTLNANERLDITVLFAPTDQKLYVDSLILAFDQPCSDERVIPIDGTGRLNVEVTISLPKLLVDPANDNQKLDIKAKLAVGTGDVNNALLRMTIKYDGSVFIARAIEPGTIVSNNTTGGQTFLNIEIPNINVGSTEQVIATITGQNTLGLVDSTALEITAATVTVANAIPKVRPENGLLALDICYVEDKRLVTKAGQLNIITRPNPAVTNVMVEAEVYETGAHTIKIVDLAGETVKTVDWNHVKGATPFTMNINAAELDAGRYQVILITPSRTKLASFTIIH